MNIAGIRIGVDLSWFLILFLLIFLLSDSYELLFPEAPELAFVLAVVSALLLFASILLHELGHAVVAIRNGIQIAGIDLFFFGGVAKMSRDTDSAGVEFRVAVAGPVVTLLIVVVCAVAGVAVAGPDGFRSTLLFETGPGPVDQVLGYLVTVNAFVLIFNLLPAFPLDGGRIVRAIAWKLTGERGKATRFAATLGRGFAILMMAAGVVLPLIGVIALISGVWFVLIGFMLGNAARAAVAQSVVSSRLEGVLVADVMDSQPIAVPAEASIERAQEEFFLRYGWPWFPVIDVGGRLLGLVTNTEIDAVPEERRSETTIESVMTPDQAGTLRVGIEDSLERLIDSRTDGLRRLGAVMAVDGDGVLRGVVTLRQVELALRPAVPVA
jgi:Zn-dependent protease